MTTTPSNQNTHSHKDNVPLWVPTASPLIERCGRAGCKAMRHCVNGVWSETPAPKAKPAPSLAQPGLWS